MAVNTGTYDISALLEVRNTSAAAFGMDTIAAVLNAELEAHNQNVAAIMSDLVEGTKDVQNIYGSSTDGAMVEVDEYGLGPTQAPRVGSQVAFPMRKFQFNTGWTNDFFRRATPSDFAQSAIDAQAAHLKKIRQIVAQAVFGSSNYTWVDKFGKGISLGVKRFVNADSAAIPDGPNGETFDGSTHTHYDATASLTNANLLASLQDVVEHGHGTGLRIAINRTNLAAVAALSDFTKLLDLENLVATTASTTARAALDTTRLDNLMVGIFNGAQVWVRPWVPANYAFVYSAGDARKPVRVRVPDWQGVLAPQLSLAATYNQHPLTAQAYESYFGAGVWTRTNGAVLYFGGASYTDPTIS